MSGSTAERSEGRSHRDSSEGGRLGGLAWLASAWLLLAIVGLLLQWRLDGSALNTRDLPLGLRWELVAWELELLALAVFLGGGVLLLLASWGGKLLGSRAAGWGRWALTVVVGLLVGLYMGSWASFVNSGQFLDASVLGFMARESSSVLTARGSYRPFAFARCSGWPCGAHTGVVCRGPTVDRFRERFHETRRDRVCRWSVGRLCDPHPG